MATVAEIIGAAVARSVRNKGGQLAGDVELLNAFNRSLAGMFSAAARINPNFFAKTSDVAAEAFGGQTRWPWPTDVNLIFYLEHVGVTLEEVAVVPYDDRQAEMVQPAVYQQGLYYYNSGNPLDPTGSLRFWYSRRPTVAGSVGATIDPGWPDSFNDLLVSELALYLSLKDNRPDELAMLRDERDRWLAQFANFLESISVIERRRRPNIRTFNSPGVIALGKLLAGGGAV